MLKLLRYINWSELSGLLVGAVLAIAIGIAVLITVKKLQQEGILGKKEYSLYSDLVSGQGLRKGTTVQINGVDIGTVDNVSISDNGLVRLKLAIDVKYQKWITNKSVLFPTRDQNIISERVVNIDISQKGNRILEDEDFITAGSAQDIETVLKTANELIASINKLVVAADSLLYLVMDTNTTIGMLLGSRDLYNNLDNAAIRLSGLLGDVNGLVDDASSMFSTLNSSMPKAMAFADTLSTSVMGLMGGLDNLTGRASNLMNSLDTTMNNVGSMVNNLQSVVGMAGNIITDGSQTISNADDLIGGVSKIFFIRSKIPKKDSIPLLEEAW
jgi:phospholipid/cholesterol/gamma-HCH transport system substrate-binding protein